MKCTMTKNTDWREQYRQVLFEADPEKLQMGIEVANQAIQGRICELWDVQPADICELTQLAYASYFLGLLTSIAEQPREAGAHLFRRSIPRSSAREEML
jgi:hypothetical protein